MSYLGKLIDAEVSNRIQAWAKKIKLTRSDPQFARFRVDVANALHTCIVLHIAEQDLRQLEKPVQGLARSVRVLKKFTRIADMRRRLEKDAKEARYLAQQLRKKQEAKKRWNLEQRLRDFSSKYKGPTLVVVGRGGSGRELDLAAPAVEDLDELASLLKEAAAACKDRGGPTRNMEAFDVLAEGLIGAYHRATGRKGTGGNVREAGRRSRERELVEDVLLTANELAIAVTGKPLKAPAIGFLGDRLEEIAKRLLKRAKPPKSNR